MNKLDEFIKLRANGLSKEYLHLIILVTEQCNFRCIYCSQDFQERKLSNDNIEGIKNFIMYRKNFLKYLHIEWFGGEPLLAKKEIFQLSESINLLCENNNIEYGYSITTNASLLDFSTFEKLNKFKCNYYQISLDGNEETHNLTRRSRSGQATFNKIYANLLETKKSNDDFLISIRVHLTNSNYDSIKKLLKRISIDFNNDERYKVFLRQISDFGSGQTKDYQDILLKSPKEQIYELKKPYNFIRTLYDSEEKNYICYASKPNSFVIRSNGQINKCSVHLGHKHNIIGDLNKDGSINFFSKKQASNWFNVILNEDMSILGCPASFMKKAYANVLKENEINCKVVNE